MATKERIHQLVDSMPDTPETELRLDAIKHQLESNGNGPGDDDDDDDDDHPVDEARIHRLQEVFETFASIDFLPRKDAWH